MARFTKTDYKDEILSDERPHPFNSVIIPKNETAWYYAKMLNEGSAKPEYYRNAEYQEMQQVSDIR